MKQVLDVGNCDHDHGQIRALLEQAFAVHVQRCHSASEALAALRQTPFDLVLVNRIFDQDHAEGMNLIRSLKAEPNTASISCMLISNYAEHQAAAVALGALPGFGKRELAAPATRARLAAVLA